MNDRLPAIAHRTAPRARALGLVLALVPMASAACDAAPKTDAAKPAPADAKQGADARPASADAKPAAADAKGGLAATAEAAVDEAKAAAIAAAKQKYRPGMLPPEGMSPEELKVFALGVDDPTEGTFTLEQAFEGDPALADQSKGKLMVAFDTTMGAFECELYEDAVPLTVANFVGLARGVRPTWDKKQNAWVTKKFYDGNIFHRVIKNFMIQTGDDTNSGRGNPGYVIVDEFDKKLRHDSAGVLSMANRSKPNTGSTQFFITVRDTKHLDGKHAVFGKCPDASVPIEISKVKVDNRAGDRPYEQVKINSVTILRK